MQTFNNPQAIDAITQSIAQDQYDIAVKQNALTIVQNGYQSDQAANATAIASGIAAGIAPIQDNLTTAQGLVTTLTAQVTTLLAVGGWTDFATYTVGTAAGFTNNVDYQASLATP